MDDRVTRIRKLRRMLTSLELGKSDSLNEREYDNAKLFADEIAKAQKELERLEAEDGAS